MLEDNLIGDRIKPNATMVNIWGGCSGTLFIRSFLVSILASIFNQLFQRSKWILFNTFLFIGYGLVWLVETFFLKGGGGGGGTIWIHYRTVTIDISIIWIQSLAVFPPNINMFDLMNCLCKRNISKRKEKKKSGRKQMPWPHWSRGRNARRAFGMRNTISVHYFHLTVDSSIVLP